MIWKMLSWAVHQIFGTKRGDSIMAALKHDDTVTQVVALGDAVIASAETDLLKKAGM